MDHRGLAGGVGIGLHRIDEDAVDRCDVDHLGRPWDPARPTPRANCTSSLSLSATLAEGLRQRRRSRLGAHQNGRARSAGGPRHRTAAPVLAGRKRRPRCHGQRTLLASSPTRAASQLGHRSRIPGRARQHIGRAHERGTSSGLDHESRSLEAEPSSKARNSQVVLQPFEEEVVKKVGNSRKRVEKRLAR